MSKRAGIEIYSRMKIEVARHIKMFLDRVPLSRSTLTLGATGMNPSFQYLTLSLLGSTRLCQLKQINIISGSCFAFLCSLALSRKKLSAWNPGNMSTYEEARRKCYGVQRIFTALKQIAYPVTRKASLSSKSHASILDMTVDENFASLTISDLPGNPRFWLFDEKAKELCFVDKESSLNDMPIRDLVQCATSVPWLFGHTYYQGREFSDPEFSSKAKHV